MDKVNEETHNQPVQQPFKSAPVPRTTPRTPDLHERSLDPGTTQKG